MNEPLEPNKQDLVNKAKALPKKAGRPEKSFGPVIKAAALVLKDTGLTQAEIAAELGVSPATVNKMLRDKSIKIEKADLNNIREDYSQTINQIVLKMLNTANTQDYIDQLAQSKNPGLIQGLGLLIEKLNLLQGKPSAIMEVRDTAKLVESKMQELIDLEQALRAITPLPESPKEN